MDKLRNEAQTANRAADPSRLDIRVGRIVSIEKVHRNETFNSTLIKMIIVDYKLKYNLLLLCPVAP